MSTAQREISAEQRVQAFLAEPRKLLINGKWTGSVSGKTFKTYNPATGEVLAEVAEGDKADIDLAVHAARTTFESKSWRRMSPSITFRHEQCRLKQLTAIPWAS